MSPGSRTAILALPVDDVVPLLRRGAKARLFVGSRVVGKDQIRLRSPGLTPQGYTLLTLVLVRVQPGEVVHLEDSLGEDVILYQLPVSEEGQVCWREYPLDFVAFEYSTEEDEFRRRLQDAMQQRWGK